MSEHKHSHLFDREKREKMLPSRQILLNFGLREGLTMADLGCGYGHFALRAAEIVGPAGKVKAIDIEPERMGILRQLAEEQGVISRVETIQAQGETIPLADGDVQIALIANVLHELAEPSQYLKNTWRILQPDGKIWIVEWVKAETEFGPPLAERRSSGEWVELVEQAGFENIWVQDFSPTHVLLRGTKRGNYLR